MDTKTEDAKKSISPFFFSTLQLHTRIRFVLRAFVPFGTVTSSIISSFNLYFFSLVSGCNATDPCAFWQVFDLQLCINFVVALVFLLFDLRRLLVLLIFNFTSTSAARLSFCSSTFSRLLVLLIHHTIAFCYLYSRLFSPLGSPFINVRP